MQHELEMERLALKAKEKAMEASQKLQAYQMDSAAKDANQKESAAEEKRKLAAELHVRFDKLCKFQRYQVGLGLRCGILIANYVPVLFLFFFLLVFLNFALVL